MLGSSKMMFSLLSQGYGTYDGTAKKDYQEIPDQKEYFSLEDLHLPPIGSNYRIPPIEVSDYQTGPRYENKPFSLPKVENTKHTFIHVPKTYTTRKGALLLYAEDHFLPGSPKPRKKRHRIKKQSSLKLKTINDLRNYILDYKNGGDPLFLALLQKRLSGYKDHSVRPGFSPKRYIASLGNSLEEDTWNRLAATGSIKDPTLLTFDPKGAPLRQDAGLGSLFPDKPQPYSTMSLPPVSPSSSMFDSSFHFYKNGMSTGAASLISLNSEAEEYAPSSRALSPAESLSNRLPEVELLPQRRDQYGLLNAKQKEDLISQLLLQKTLESVDSDLSDLQGWLTNYPDQGGEVEQEPATMVTIPKSKAKHRGSLKSGSFSSIPRLPPIQSAGARPMSPMELRDDRTLMQASVDEERDISSEVKQEPDVVDPGSVHLDLSSLDQNNLTVDQRDLEGDEDTTGSETTANSGDNSVSNMKNDEDLAASDQAAKFKEDESVSEDSVERMEPSLIGDSSEEAMEPSDIVQGDKTDEGESIADQGVTQNDAVIALDDIILTDDAFQGDDKQGSQDEDMEGVDTEVARDEMKEASSVAGGDEGNDDTDLGAALADAEPVAKEEADETREAGSAEEDEGIGLDGGELDVSEKQENEEELNQADGIMTMEEGVGSPEPIEPPPPISLEELQGEVRTVASKVLSRPQSGMVFMDDVKTAVAMWADRLSYLLGPPKSDARVSSAGQQRPPMPGLTTQGVPNRPTRQRKVSRSAGPSVAALRKALMISGGEVPEVETLKNLPPLPERFSKPGRVHPPSGMSSGHARREQLRKGSVSTKGSASSGAAQSIPWERISNADIQADVFSYALNEPSFQRMQADEIEDEESDEDDENFKTALNAVVTEVKPDYTLIEAKSRMAVSSPKKDQQPFKFPRPVASKPPAGLQNKKPPAETKGKSKTAPAKKPAPAKKKGGKKPAKQGTKPAKTTKGTKVKTEVPKKEEPEKTEEVSEKVVEEVSVEKKPEVIRVDSETGEHEPEASDRTLASSGLSRDTSARISSKASDEIKESKTEEPSENSEAFVPELPRIVPKPPEAEPVPSEPEEKQPSPVEEQKPAQESRAARRAAERAAAAERRRQEVERKRREREEAKKRAMEEEARLEHLRLEAEEEMKRREEERRLRRQEKEEANQREREEELERERQAKIKAEKERRAREEWKKRQQQVLAQRKLEEEMRREQEKIEAELEAARLREEEERIKAMEESERIAFLEKMRREEEELRRRLEEQKQKEETERRIREEERKQREEALALLRQKQLQRHLFIAGMLKESHYLSLSQRLTKAFTFSYFDLLPWNDLQHLVPRASSPVRDLLSSVKDKIPATIVEEDENIED